MKFLKIKSPSVELHEIIFCQVISLFTKNEAFILKHFLTTYDVKGCSSRPCAIDQHKLTSHGAISGEYSGWVRFSNLIFPSKFLAPQYMDEHYHAKE